VSRKVARVLIAGDWDADGFVSAALLVYAQEKLSTFPIPSPAIVEKKPVDPERLRYLVTELSGVYDLIVLLDVPYTHSLLKVLTLVKKHLGVKRIMYIDHHVSSLINRDKLAAVVDEAYIERDTPTAVITFNLLRERGINVHSRLVKFVELIKYMDSGKRIPEDLTKLFEIVKLMSKALTVKRDPGLWTKIVEWLASPAPIPSPLEEEVFKSIKSIIEERDRVINEVAMDLALSAIKIGDFRLIDARERWKHRGASALASKLYSILKSPIILWVNTGKDYSLLIIKASGGRAYRLAKILLSEGVALDAAGHPNLAIVKISKSLDLEVLKEKIQKALYYM